MIMVSVCALVIVIPLLARDWACLYISITLNLHYDLIVNALCFYPARVSNLWTANSNVVVLL